jgi:hypothetical protein
MSGGGQHKRTVFENRFSSDVNQHCKYFDFTRSVRFAKIGGSFLPELEMRAADDYPTDFVHKESQDARRTRPDERRPDR